MSDFPTGSRTPTAGIFGRPKNSEPSGCVIPEAGIFGRPKNSDFPTGAPGTQASARLLAEAPLDVLVLIMSWMPLSGIARFVRTAKVYHRRLWLSPTLWRRLYFRNISQLRLPKGLEPAGLGIPQAGIGSIPDSAPDYRVAYREIVAALHGQRREYENRHEYEYEYECDIEYTASRGYERLLTSVLEHHPSKCDFDLAMAYAAEGAHVDIIEDMIARGAKNWDWAMARAASGGHLAILEQMIDRGGTDFEWALTHACRSCHLDIAHKMIQRGAHEWDRAMTSAVCGGHMPIILDMIERGASDWNTAMVCAAASGHLAIVKYMLDRGANSWNQAMIHAASKGHVSIIQEMIARGANNWTWALEEAAAGGHLSIVKDMIDRGATIKHNTIIRATERKHSDVVAYLTSL